MLVRAASQPIRPCHWGVDRTVTSRGVRLLLPPSEGKTTGGRGRPLRERPVDGPLGDARTRALSALHRLVDGDAAAAATALLLPDGVAADALAANRAVLDSPTTPALRRYAGVVYDGFGVVSMTPRMYRIAARCTLVLSGLFGVVRGDEPLPDYRVPAKAALPGLGIAGTFWRPVLDQVMPGLLGHGLVVDLRSSDYAAMWRPAPREAERVVAVRVLSPKPGGGLAVVSYNSKFAKGRLAAELVRATATGTEPRTADDVAVAWLRCGGKDARPDGRGRLDLITA